MNRLAFAVAFLALLPAAGLADDQSALDQCIAAWGSKSPFKKGARPDRVIGTGVKVFGLGSGQSGEDAPTDRPSLVLVRPAVNVAGKSTIRLSNPRGWYCFADTVTVMGKIGIEAHCDAQLAGARGDGTAVMAANDANHGVAVMGALRVRRFGCGRK
jgi:hypothetical protein